MEATLLAYDYANNPSYCKLVAQILDPQTFTTLQYSQVSSSFNNNLTSDIAIISPNTTPVTGHILNTPSFGSTTFADGFPRWSPNSSTSVLAHNVTIRATVTGNTSRTPDFQPAGGQTAVPTATSRQSLGRKTTSWKSLPSVTSLYTVVTETMSSPGSTNSSALLAEENRGNQHSVNGVDSSTLRLAAIVCGSLAGVAGLAIAVICVVFRCMVKHQRDRPWRRRSNDSDVTMGSSSETRSVGSYSADSLRMSRTGRSVESSSADSLRMSRTDRSVESSRADSLRMSRTDRSVESSSTDSLKMSSIGRSSGKLTESYSCRNTGKKLGNSDSIVAREPVLGGQKLLTMLNESNHVGSRHFKEDRKEEEILSRMKHINCSTDFKNEKLPYWRRETAEDIMKTRLDAPTRDKAEFMDANTSSVRKDEAGNDTTAIRATPSKRQEVEDVIFRCVTVEKAKVAEDGATGISTNEGAGTVSKQSYSPLLRSGGKTYNSMLQVQQQIEAMENQRRNLSPAASQHPSACAVPRIPIRISDDAQDEMGATTARLNQSQEHCTAASQYPRASTPPRVGFRRPDARDEMRAATARLRRYQEGSTYNNGPPGSPQFKTCQVHAPGENRHPIQTRDSFENHAQIQNHAQIISHAQIQKHASVQNNTASQNPEIFHVQSPNHGSEMRNIQGEHQNQCNVSTRRYFPPSDISVAESDRNCIQITTSDSTGLYSQEDTPHYLRFQRESIMQQDCPGVGPNEPHMSPNTKPGPDDGMKHTAEVAQHVDSNDYECYDKHIRSRAAGRSSYRDLASEGTSQRQYSETYQYNQTQAKPFRSRKHFRISQTAPSQDSNNTLRAPKKQPYQESGRIHNNKPPDHYSRNESGSTEDSPYQEESIRFQNNRQPDHYYGKEFVTSENPPYQEERSRFENNKRQGHYYGNESETPEKPSHREESRSFQSNKRPDSNTFGISQALAHHDKEDSRSIQNRNRPNPSAVAEGNQRYLDITNDSHPSHSKVARVNGAYARSSGSNQVFVRVPEQTGSPKTPICVSSRESTSNSVSIDTHINNEIGKEETNTPRVTMSSIPTPTQTPSNSRSESPDSRYLQPGNGSKIVSDANQMALRHDIEHIRQKLLKFQRRIDHEIEEESRRSGESSPCPSDN